MSRSPVCFVISRGVSSGPWIIDAYSGLRPDDSMATMAPSRSGGNICRLL
jgi:hypothetical protein